MVTTPAHAARVVSTPAVAATTSTDKARVTIEVPTDAKVYVEDQATKTDGATRLFTTPSLQSGQDYVYTIRVEVIRDGRTLSETKKLTVRAGGDFNASFHDLGKDTGVARARE